jgi:hypothetical protein
MRQGLNTPVGLSDCRTLGSKDKTGDIKSVSIGIVNSSQQSTVNSQQSTSFRCNRK